MKPDSGVIVGLALSGLSLGGCLDELTSDETLADPEQVLALSEALPDWSSRCSACLLESCPEPLARCVNDRGCSDFVRCRWGREGDSSPAGELRCGELYGQTPEAAQSATRSLSNCWQNECVDACALGTEWGCLANYEMPPPDPRGAVTIAQTLQDDFSEEPIVGATVRFCDLLESVAACTSRADAVVSDARGAAVADVSISTGERPGWNGYRHVFVDGVFDAVLQSNLVVPRDRFMLQQVPTSELVGALGALVGANPSRPQAIFQVFDCAHTAAKGARVELWNSDSSAPLSDAYARVGYGVPGSFLLLPPPATTDPEAQGGGALVDLPSERMSVRVTTETGSEIATLFVNPSANRILLLEIHPAPTR
jgi:hypothetical protein